MKPYIPYVLYRCRKWTKNCKGLLARNFPQVIVSDWVSFSKYLVVVICDIRKQDERWTSNYSSAHMIDYLHRWCIHFILLIPPKLYCSLTTEQYSLMQFVMMQLYSIIVSNAFPDSLLSLKCRISILLVQYSSWTVSTLVRTWALSLCGLFERP